MAPVGGLFLLATLPELRKQGLGHLALYTLERTVQETLPWHENGFPVSAIRGETGLNADEISKACAFLKKSDLVTIERVAGNGRERVLIPTKRGIYVLDKILAAAADRLWNDLPRWARGRRVSETTRILHKASDKLLGPIQLSFFDKCAVSQITKRPGKATQSSTTSKTRTEKPRVRKPKEPKIEAVSRSRPAVESLVVLTVARTIGMGVLSPLCPRLNSNQAYFDRFRADEKEKRVEA